MIAISLTSLINKAARAMVQQSLKPAINLEYRVICNHDLAYLKLLQ